MDRTASPEIFDTIANGVADRGSPTELRLERVADDRPQRYSVLALGAPILLCALARAILGPQLLRW
jgi:hypothetical protein